MSLQATPATGSTLHVPCPAMLAIVPGSRFTAGVIRRGTDALDGFTLALPFQQRAADPNAVLDDPETLRTYFDRVTDQAYDLWERHFAPPVEGEPPLDVVVGWAARPGKGSHRSTPLRDWVIPRMLTCAVVSAFQGAEIHSSLSILGTHRSSRGGSGNAMDYYPRVLIKQRPSSWALNEHYENTRDYEQAAFVLAGLAELERRAR
jgi:hypothetical protein